MVGDAPARHACAGAALGPRRSGFDGVVAAAGQADMGSKVVHVDRGDDEDPATVAEVDCGQAAEAGSSVSFKDDDGISVVIEYDGAKLSMTSEKSLKSVRSLADPLSVEHVTALRYGYNRCTKTHFLSADGTTHCRAHGANASRLLAPHHPGGGLQAAKLPTLHL